MSVSNRIYESVGSERWCLAKRGIAAVIMWILLPLNHETQEDL